MIRFPLTPIPPLSHALLDDEGVPYSARRIRGRLALSDKILLVLADGFARTTGTIYDELRQGRSLWERVCTPRWRVKRAVYKLWNDRKIALYNHGYLPEDTWVEVRRAS